MKESDLCAVLVNDLKIKGYEVYQEVVDDHGRADIVAVKNSIQWVIEVKSSNAEGLYQQAIKWKGKGHIISTASPTIPKIDARQYLRENGIGIIVISKNDFIEYRFPKLNVLATGLSLYEEQKTVLNAGTNYGGWWNPKTGRLSNERR
jgi:hypothetical protein